jgi:RNA polymerase sigma factor (sigma-70 family)
VAALSDDSLLVGMAAGDSQAAAAFVRRYQARVYGLALTIVRTPEAAEDVAQEAFVKAWRHAAAYDARRGPVATWLLTITRNAAIDAVRYHRDAPMDPGVLQRVLDGRSDLGGAPAVDLDTREQLRSALRELPPEQSRPLVLMVFYGLTAKEVAGLDGTPVGTVKTRVRRSLRTLRERLGVTDA